MSQQTATLDLRVRRLERGMSVLDLVEKCRERGVEVHRTTLWRIERGDHTNPKPALRKALAEVLDLDVTDFDQEAS